MRLHLEMPPGSDAARRYAAEALFKNLLGLEVILRPAQGTDWHLSDPEGQASLSMPDSFFRKAQGAWLQPASVPAPPLPCWQAHRDLPEAVMLDLPVPIVAGEACEEGRWWKQEGQNAWLGLDVLGSAFFLLSRYEEVAQAIQDRHERFPATASLAFRSGFLERPLLDEYAALLWAALKRLWPALRRPERQGELRFTCDVDHPYEGSSKRLALLMRALAGDLVVRRHPREAVARLGRVRQAWRGDYSQDPVNTFDWLQQRCRAHDRRATFYFIAGHTGGEIDGCYRIDEDYLLSLLKRIHDHGHRIAVHGSYNSFRDATVLRRERTALTTACHAAGCDQEITAIRQHYLRWDSGCTPALMQESGFTCDSTGAFADHAGFRYGTSHSFPLWDWREERALQLREQPLIVMEWSVIGPRYMNLGRTAAALEKMQTLEARCLQFGGDFTLLWHNDLLRTSWDRSALAFLLSRDRSWPLEVEAAAAE